MIKIIDEDKIKQIAELLEEAATRFNATQVCNDSDREIRKYADKIYELSEWHIQLERYLSDTNMESGRYKITARCDDKEYKDALAKYWEQVK